MVVKKLGSGDSPQWTVTQKWRWGAKGLGGCRWNSLPLLRIFHLGTCTNFVPRILINKILTEKYCFKFHSRFTKIIFIQIHFTDLWPEPPTAFQSIASSLQVAWSTDDFESKIEAVSRTFTPDNKYTHMYTLKSLFYCLLQPFTILLLRDLQNLFTMASNIHDCKSFTRNNVC